MPPIDPIHYLTNDKAFIPILAASAALVCPVKNPVSLGILLTGFAYMLFTAHDAAIKLLVATVPVWQILAASCIIVIFERRAIRATA